MNLINIENLTKVYTERKLFDNTSFSLQDGEKVGVIGINGTGKTTLLRMIMGEEETDEAGMVKTSYGTGSSIMMHTGPVPVYSENGLSTSVAFGYRGMVSYVLEGNVTEENRWSVESDAKAMMTRLGIKDFMQPAGQLSGGQRKRLALISVLLSPADILLLDEPTNHLDNDMADWLEDYLKKWRGALIMVTHDRYFLDSVCNRIVEIDKGKIYSYQTNYSGYLELKTQRQEMEAASERKRQSILRVELEWIRRGARARSTKQKAHIQRHEELRDRQAPVQDSQVELSSISTRMGKTTVELENICKSYGERKLIDDFSYIFARYEKMGIVGNNGTGKSTFIKILMGQVAPDSGTVDVGETVRFGYYSQDGLQFDEQMKVIDVVQDIAEVIELGNGKKLTASQFLQHFLFTPETQHSYVYKLSGGERRRLYLCTILMRNPNFLVLDEPTNDLDIITLNVLEEYLQNFKGCVIVVSHDRYFMDKVVDHLMVFNGQGDIRDFPGNYSDYRDWKDAKAQKEKEAEKPQEEKTARVRLNDKRKMSFKEKREFEQLEKEIAELETEKVQIEELLCSGTLSVDELTEKSKRLPEVNDLIDEKTMRWLELSEIEG